VVERLPRQQIMRQQPPGTAAAQHTENPIGNFAYLGEPRLARPLRRRPSCSMTPRYCRSRRLIIHFRNPTK
jgi:hypothetical protein